MKAILRCTASVAVLAAFAATSARAQDDQPTSVDEIIVTAQKREQRLQDVPIVVTSISEQLLEDTGVRDIKDLQILTPGLTVTSTSNETITTARIRGVGTVGDNPGLESSVGVVIDGVYRPRNGVGFGDLGEVERIEVLKGPQGTLFGKNTSAGVINILTQAPEFEPGFEGELTAGNYNAFGASASVTGPLVADKLAGRLFAAYRTRGGFLDVVTGPGPRTEDEDVDQNFWTVRGQLLATPNDRLTMRFIADYTKRDENCCLGTGLSVGAAPTSRANLINLVRPGSLDLTSTPFDRIAYANRDTTQDIEDMGVSGQIDFDLTDNITLTSITAWRNWDAITGQDSDFTAADLVWRPDNGENRVGFGQFSQELRLAGENGRLAWLIGAFYAQEDLENDSALLYGSDYYAYFADLVLGGAPRLLGLVPGTIFQTGNGSRDHHDQDATTFAVFTNNTITLFEGLELTLGLRYTMDEKELTSVYTTTGGSCDQGEAAFPTIAALVGTAAAGQIVGGMCLNHQNQEFDRLGTVVQQRDDNEFSGTAKLAYRWNPDLMTYVSYSRGFKAGGFNLDRTGRTIITPTGPNFAANPDTSFDAEIADSYEVGLKATLAGGSLLFNTAFFYQTFEDFQLNTFVGTAFIVETIPEVTSVGVDTDFIWITPVEGLTFQGGLTYANTEYGDFVAADLKEPSRFNSLFRLPGSQISFAPEWSFSLAGTYERPVGDNLLLRASAAVKWLSDYNTGSDLSPVKEQDAYALLNGRIGIGARDERWMLELWGMNLTDEDYLQVGFNGPFQVVEDTPTTNNTQFSVYNAFLGAPRTFGVTLRVKFGAESEAR